MNRFFSIGWLLIMSSMIMGQINGFDLKQMADEEIVGSSRYVGLCGAMAAIGGDMSAVKDNPAALGVFRYSEIGMTVCSAMGKTTTVSVPGVDILLSLNRGKMSGVVAHNLMFSFQRRKHFGSDYSISAQGLETSQTDLMAAMADGYTVDQLANMDGIGFLAYAGFDSWLIDTIVGGNGRQWGTLEPGRVNAQLQISESGSVDDYQFNWGMNISHRVYIGAGAYIRSLSYTKETVYCEQFESSNSYRLRSGTFASGIGIGASAGVIWRPLSMIRLGLALQTPAMTAVNLQHTGDILADIEGKTYGNDNYRQTWQGSILMPWRAVAGAAWQIATHGLLSAEYDFAYRHQMGMQAQHMVKVGAEWAITQSCFLDAGYAAQWYGGYVGNESVNRLTENAQRLDTDQQAFSPKHYASAGFTYRNRWLTAGIAYQFSRRAITIWAHQYQNAPMGIANDINHKVVMTLGFRLGI